MREDVVSRLPLLDDERYDVRERALGEIIALGPAAAAHLPAQDDPALPMETRVRVARIRGVWETALSEMPAAGEPLRRIRAAAILGRIGGETASRALRDLAASGEESAAARLARILTTPQAE